MRPRFSYFRKALTIVLANTGKELDEFMERHGGWKAFDRVVYVGDGGNDFCPILRLRTYVSPRCALFLHSLMTLAAKMWPLCGRTASSRVG